MQKIAILLLLALIWSCQADTASTEQVNSDKTMAEQVESTTTAAKEKTAKPKTETPKEDPKVGTRKAFQPPQSKDILRLSTTSTKAKSGGVACVDVKATQFTNLLSMQYTLSWDPAILKYKGIQNIGLPHMTQQNFGGNRLSEGLLPFVWIDNALKGVTLSNNSTIYTLCFDVIGQAGQSSEIKFVERPTPFEVVNLAEEILKLQATAGTISIE
jgi:hypothetical protein